MSDEPKPLKPASPAGAPLKRPGLPGAGLGAAAKGPRPPRPALQPPPVSEGSLRLRKHLMLGILITCVVLVGMIGYRLYMKYHVTVQGPRDIDSEFEKLQDTCKGASKDIFTIETKVWGRNEELKPEDFVAIKGKLAELRDAHDKMKDLLDLLHARGLDDSGTKAKIVPQWLQCKVWILDGADLLENPKPPDYGGLNIPMFVTSEKIRKAQKELADINTTKDEVIQRNDAAEIKTVRKKISDLRDAFRGHATKLQELDKYLVDGLARPDLTNKEAMELEQLRDDANKAQMSVVAAGKILQAFPE